ncbi:MAG: hypothetical protein GC150_07565 [Rhizobiales bacterium]|nr:hypothetical protein [Hyphomicrobiales bacterium]
MTRLLLIEDRKGVRDALAGALTRLKVDVVSPEVMTYDGNVNDSAIRDAIGEAPNVVIIDLVWDTEDRSRSFKALDEMVRILEGAAKGGAPIPTYLLTGYRFAPDRHEETLRQWRGTSAINARLTVIDLVSKPISAESLKALLPTNGEQLPTHTVEFDIRNLPVAARLIDATDRAVASNDTWSWGLNEPNTETLKGGGRTFVQAGGESNLHKGSGTRTLIPYRIVEATVDGPRRLQLAYPQRLPRSGSRQQILGDLFESLREIGFTRMRYYERYRVPSTVDDASSVVTEENVVALLHWFPDNPTIYPHLDRFQQGTPIIDQPGDTFVDNCSAFDQDEQPGRLIHELTQPSIKSVTSRFTTLTSTDNRYVRLRVPVFRRDGQHNTRFYAEGLLVLDRNSVTDRQDVDQRQDVDHDDVLWATAPLLSACEELRQLLDRERRRQEIVVNRRITELYRTIHENVSIETDPEHLAKSFLAAAREVTDAKEGVLFRTAHPARPPEILAVARVPNIERANQVEYREPHLEIGAQLDRNKHPAAGRAWEEERDVYLPHFKRKTKKGKEREQSRVAILLRAGSRRIGVLALMHDDARHFRRRRIEALNRLVALLSFPLQFATERADRREWERVLAHDLKHTFLGVAGYVQELDKTYPKLRSDADRRAAMSLIKRATDTTEAILFLQKPVGATESTKPSERPTRFDIEPVLIEEVDDHRSMAEVRDCKLRLTLRDKGISLDGEKLTFAMIVRILLHNAIHHGTRDKTITVTAQIDGDRCHLTIVNAGRMSDEADRHKYVAFHQSRDKKRSGVHIGLAAARKMAKSLNVELSVDNDPRPSKDRVIATLVWPLAGR